MAEWGYTDTDARHYEEDHLIPLELGGAPANPLNLWPEPRLSAAGWTARRKDDLAAALRGMVCAGRITLRAAQRDMAGDWTTAYRRLQIGQWP